MHACRGTGGIDNNLKDTHPHDVDGIMKHTCPACNHESHVSVSAMVPPESRIFLEVKKADDSQWFSADTIGELITATDRLLKATARDCGGKVSVFVADVRLTDGCIVIEFAIIQQKQKPKSKRKVEHG